jgi:hypothetical protein
MGHGFLLAVGEAVPPRRAGRTSMRTANPRTTCSRARRAVLCIKRRQIVYGKRQQGPTRPPATIRVTCGSLVDPFERGSACKRRLPTRVSARANSRRASEATSRPSYLCSSYLFGRQIHEYTNTRQIYEYSSSTRGNGTSAASQLEGSACGSHWQIPLADPIGRSHWQIPLADPIGRSHWQIPLADPIGRSHWQIPLADPIGRSHWQIPLADPIGRSADPRTSIARSILLNSLEPSRVRPSVRPSVRPCSSSEAFEFPDWGRRGVFDPGILFFIPQQSTIRAYIHGFEYHAVE